jgi:hypothetical protein
MARYKPDTAKIGSAMPADAALAQTMHFAQSLGPEMLTNSPRRKTNASHTVNTHRLRSTSSATKRFAGLGSAKTGPANRFSGRFIVMKAECDHPDPHRELSG